MGDKHVLTRREFTRESALAVLAGVTITVSGCGDDSPSGPSGSPNDEVGSVSANHGHSAVITEAQLQAGNAISLNIRGNAPHPHTVDLSATELQQISAGQRVSKVSSNDDGHTHDVTFN